MYSLPPWITTAMFGILKYDKNEWLDTVRSWGRNKGHMLTFAAGIERLRPVGRAAALLVLTALAVHYQVLQAHRHSKGVFRDTIAEISRQAGPDDLLYVARELEFFPAEYYFDPSRVFVFGRKYDAIKAYTGKVLIPRMVR